MGLAAQAALALWLAGRTLEVNPAAQAAVGGRRTGHRALPPGTVADKADV